MRVIYDDRDSFSFCGVHITDLGLGYAPEGKDVLPHQTGEWSAQEVTFDGHDGGYYYGQTLNPKEFTLRCYYDHYQPGRFAQIEHLFRRGTTGRLVFDSRPWCYYTATVSAPIEYAEIYNTLGGVITIHMKAYFPFARCDSMVNEYTDPCHDTIMWNTALFDRPELQPETDLIASGSSMLNETTILLGNPGTEPTPVSLAIAGNTGDGVKIRNVTTGQEMQFVAMSKADTTTAGKYVLFDGITGKTMITDGTTSELAFIYHDYGHIDLAPGYPAHRNIHAHFTNSTTVTTTNLLYENMVGKYIWLGEWLEIVAQNGLQTLTVERAPTPTEDGYLQTTIMDMNKIIITPVRTMELTKLEFMFQPLFS